MRILIAVLALPLLLIPVLAQANVIPPGHHPVEHCFSIDNANDYTDYVFKLVGADGAGNARELTVTEAVSCTGNLRGLATLLAVKAEDESKITPVPETETGVAAGMWWTQEPNAEYLVWSQLVLELPSTIPDTDSATQVNHALHIDGFEDGQFGAHELGMESSHASTVRNSNVAKTLAIGAVVVLGAIGLIYAFALWRK